MSEVAEVSVEKSASASAPASAAVSAASGGGVNKGLIAAVAGGLGVVALLVVGAFALRGRKAKAAPAAEAAPVEKTEEKAGALAEAAPEPEAAPAVDQAAVALEAVAKQRAMEQARQERARVEREATLAAARSQAEAEARAASAAWDAHKWVSPVPAATRGTDEWVSEVQAVAAAKMSTALAMGSNPKVSSNVKKSAAKGYDDQERVSMRAGWIEEAAKAAAEEAAELAAKKAAEEAAKQAAKDAKKKDKNKGSDSKDDEAATDGDNVVVESGEVATAEVAEANPSGEDAASDTPADGEGATDAGASEAQSDEQPTIPLDTVEARVLRRETKVWGDSQGGRWSQTVPLSSKARWRTNAVASMRGSPVTSQQLQEAAASDAELLARTCAGWADGPAPSAELAARAAAGGALDSPAVLQVQTRGRHLTFNGAGLRSLLARTPGAPAEGGLALDLLVRHLATRSRPARPYAEALAAGAPPAELCAAGYEALVGPLAIAASHDALSGALAKSALDLWQETGEDAILQHGVDPEHSVSLLDAASGRTLNQMPQLQTQHGLLNLGHVLNAALNVTYHAYAGEAAWRDGVGETAAAQVAELADPGLWDGALTHTVATEQAVRTLAENVPRLRELARTRPPADRAHQPGPIGKLFSKRSKWAPAELSPQNTKEHQTGIVPSAQGEEEGSSEASPEAASEAPPDSTPSPTSEQQPKPDKATKPTKQQKKAKKTKNKAKKNKKSQKNEPHLETLAPMPANADEPVAPTAEVVTAA